MRAILYVRDRDGAFIATDTNLEASSVSLQPHARWNGADPDQHGTAMLWTYDDQRSIAISPLGAVLVDASVWTLHGIHVAESQDLRVFVSPVEGYSDPFSEKGGEKGAEKGGVYRFVAKGADVLHGTQLIARATSSNFARRIAESLTLYRGRLSSDRRDQRRKAEKGGI